MGALKHIISRLNRCTINSFLSQSCLGERKYRLRVFPTSSNINYCRPPNINIHKFSSVSQPNHTKPDEFTKRQVVSFVFLDKSGKEIPVSATVGKNLLEIAHENNIELEGACGGELACATCHLVFEKHIYDALPSKVPEEDDMLDLAFKLTDTSRLGCQIRVEPFMKGMRVQIPDDGY